MQDVKRLVVMVGLPRSGKSTRARDMGHPIVCPDDIRLAVHGEAYIQSAEPYVWAIAKTMVKSLFRSGHDIVILDAANNTKKRRDEWRSYDDEWVRIFHTISTSSLVCFERAEADGRRELIPIIERMDSQHEPVTEAELADGEGMNIPEFYEVGPEGKRPLSIDIYDSRTIIVREGKRPLSLIQGIKLQASSTMAAALEVVLPALTQEELAASDVGKSYSDTIDTLQAHGAQVVFAHLADIAPEANPDEQGLAEDALQQIGLLRSSIREALTHTIGEDEVDESDRPTLTDMFNGDKKNDGP